MQVPPIRIPPFPFPLPGLLFSSLLLLAACNPSTATDAGLPADAASDLTCDGGAYPCGPFGTGAGAVAADATFIGYMDPGHVCKDNSAMKIDLTAQRTVSLRDWYRGGAGCPGKRRLLWISVSAGWCPSCRTPIGNLQTLYAAGTLDRRIGVIDVVLETTEHGQAADGAFLLEWIKLGGLTFPVVLDPAGAMRKHFSLTELPAAVLLDLQTMTVAHKATGAQTKYVEQAAATILAK